MEGTEGAARRSRRSTTTKAMNFQLMLIAALLTTVTFASANRSKTFRSP